MPRSPKNSFPSRGALHQRGKIWAPIDTIRPNPLMATRIVMLFPWVADRTFVWKKLRSGLSDRKVKTVGISKFARISGCSTSLVRPAAAHGRTSCVTIGAVARVEAGSRPTGECEGRAPPCLFEETGAAAKFALGHTWRFSTGLRLLCQRTRLLI